MIRALRYLATAIRDAHSILLALREGWRYSRTLTGTEFRMRPMTDDEIRAEIARLRSIKSYGDGTPGTAALALRAMEFDAGAIRALENALAGRGPRPQVVNR